MCGHANRYDDQDLLGRAFQDLSKPYPVNNASYIVLSWFVQGYVQMVKVEPKPELANVAIRAIISTGLIYTNLSAISALSSPPSTFRVSFSLSSWELGKILPIIRGENQGIHFKSS